MSYIDEKSGVAPTKTQHTVDGVILDALQPSTTQVSHHFTKHAAEHEQGDIAMQYVHNAHEGQEIPPEMRRRLAFKSNVYLFLFMGWCYCLQFADKTIVSGMSVLGLRDDDIGLAMHGEMYSWVGSAFYFGYLVGIIPMVFIMQRFPVAKVTSICYLAWAIILTCSAGAQEYPGFVATRVLLGIFESSVTPAFTILTTQWFPRNQHFSRICFWFGFNGLGTIMATSVAYGMYIHGADVSGAPWRALVLVFGLITVLTAVIFYFHVPDTPVQAWFLNDEERTWQVELIREQNSSAGYGTRVIKKYQIWEAIIDPATWLAGAYIFLSDVPNGAATNFSTLILQGMGFESTKQSLLMTLPGGGTEFVGCFLTSVVSLYVFRNYRGFYMLLSSAAAVLCYCLLAWGPNYGSQLFGNYASSWFGPIGMIAALSNIGSNCGGYTKKLVTNGIFLLMYAAGNIVGPQTFKESEAPGYATGKTSMAATDAAALLMIALLWLLNVFRNWRRNKKNEKLPDDLENPEFADLTDLENPEFRYAL